MGVLSGGYKLLLLLHILTVVVGIGTVSLNGLYGRESKQRQGPEGRAVAEATDFVTHVAQYVIYLIPVTGILLVLSSDDVWRFGQTWIWLSLVLYVIAIGISHGILAPTVRKMISLMKELEAGPPPTQGPPPQAAQLERLGRTAGMAGGALNLFMVIFIALMIWKPGV